MFKTFLMCEPTFYGVEYSINPWMEGQIGKVNKTLAKEQWRNLYENLKRHANVLLIDPWPNLPDMVFTANCGLAYQLIYPTGKEVGKHIAISNFTHKERQGESVHFQKFFKDLGYNAHITKAKFEGAGDALYDYDGNLWCGHGLRTKKKVYEELITHRFASPSTPWMDDKTIKPLTLKLVDERFYHLDTCFCPLHESAVMIYDGAFSEKSLGKIYDHFETVICVDVDDAEKFACNAVVVGDSIFTTTISQQLKNDLASQAFTVIENDMSEFIKSGGSCKCLTFEL